MPQDQPLSLIDSPDDCGFHDDAALHAKAILQRAKGSRMRDRDCDGNVLHVDADCRGGDRSDGRSSQREILLRNDGDF